MTPNPLITLRAMSIADHKFILKQADQFAVFGPYVEVFQRILNGNPVPGVQVQNLQFFIGEIDGAAAGFLALEWKTGEAMIHGVAVSADYKRQGVASCLLTHILVVAQDKGVHSLKAITAETANPAALALFGAHGFENQGRAGNYPAGQRAVHLCRELHPAV